MCKNNKGLKVEKFAPDYPDHKKYPGSQRWASASEAANNWCLSGICLFSVVTELAWVQPGSCAMSSSAPVVRSGLSPVHAARQTDRQTERGAAGAEQPGESVCRHCPFPAGALHTAGSRNPLLARLTSQRCQHKNTGLTYSTKHQQKHFARISESYFPHKTVETIVPRNN